ncbi:hypothetical protein DDE74_02810 [Streptomyces lydicus]|uniref:Thymidylate kinase-like domain-containing protein n=1 Tax=Streptomyces lydicus TaxID=47763 RepID=A0A3S9YMJ0_9ACTN|nr:hypothetical protein DDE74_02810 [Streptomyces lydicus]
MSGTQGRGGSPTAPAFCVVLGPDYAGKSSALSELSRREPDWRIFSVDDAFLTPGHSLISRLRRELVGEVVPVLHRDYSVDFMMTLMQTAVLHLRDSIMRSTGGTPIVVDSYFYKILAKCRLSGVDEHPLYDWWRSFPPPRRVIYLDVAPETAWHRCGTGRDLNPLEYYGERPGWLSFESFQSDLHKTLTEEIGPLPVTTVAEAEHGQASRIAQDIREVVTHEYV